MASFCRFVLSGQSVRSGNSALVVQIVHSDSSQAMPSGYLDDLSILNAQIALPECTRRHYQHGYFTTCTTSR
jgi:hypothetical protein